MPVVSKKLTPILTNMHTSCPNGIWNLKVSESSKTTDAPSKASSDTNSATSLTVADFSLRATGRLNAFFNSEPSKLHISILLVQTGSSGD